MYYRKFGNLGFEVSQLGFGCMRFPVMDENMSKIDEQEAEKMLLHAIDMGLNYIDTAYPYHQKMSEPFVGKIIKKNNLRDKIKLATKLPVWLCKDYTDFDKYLNEQLERLKTDYIDFYLLHSLNEEYWNNINNLKVFDFLQKARNDGKIKYIGFSFHDNYNLFEKIVDSYNWDFCQIQLNYMDESYQAGLKGLKYVANKNIPTIIMEPIKGGKLATEPKGELKEIWEKSGVECSPAQLALKYLWNMTEITCVLSGMSTLSQVKENILTASNSYINSLTEKERNLINILQNFYKSKFKIGCTDCKYCMPCPQKVEIPDIFKLYNEASVYNILSKSKNTYNNFLKHNIGANQCIECGNCEKHCPQNLPIIEMLKEIHNVFTIKL